MTLDEIIDQCWEDSGKWFPFNTGTPAGEDAHITFLLLALAGEVGEACNEWKKFLRGSGSWAEALEKTDEELIDVFIYLCNLFYARGINVEAAYARKRAFNQQRFDRNTSAGVDVVADHGKGSEASSQ